MTRASKPIALSPSIPSFHRTTSKWSPPSSPGAKSEYDLASDLFVAACRGDLAGIQIALSQGASVNSSVLVPGVFEAFKPAKPGHLSPLAGAASYAQVSAVQYLLTHGAELNPPSSRSASSPLHQACRGSHRDIVQRLLDHGAIIDIENVYRETPIMYANKYASPDVVSLLLQYRPNLEKGSFMGATPIHWAVWSGRPEVLNLLLEARANPNQTAPDGNTAIHYAVVVDSPRRAMMVKCLLKHGANPLQRNESDETPLDLAERQPGPHTPQIIAMLKAVIAMNG